MALPFGEYLVGLVLAGIYVAAAGIGGYLLRRRLLPVLDGPEGRLAEVVLALAVALGIAVALGLVGLLVREALLVAALTVAGALLLLHVRSPPATATGAVTATNAGTPLVAAALAAAAVVISAWAARTLRVIEIGIVSVDGLWFHGPLAARFAERGSIRDLHFLDVEILAPTFYPANSELLNAVGILLTGGRDFVLPALALAWPVLLLLAAWCFGRRFGRAPLAMLGAAAVLATPALVLTQAGGPKNDVMALALLMAAIALLAGAGGRPAGLAVSGLAAGIAVGTKLTVAAPVLVLAIGVVAIAPTGRRAHDGLWWTVPAVAGGGVWFARNIAHAHSPFPVLDLGPLPSVEEPPAAHTGHSVSDYVADAAVWRDWYLPGLSDMLGPLWPGLLGLAALGLLLGLVARDAPLLRLLAVAGIASAVLYAFTPYSAGGPEGEPRAFWLNVRWLAPALLIGLMLLAASPRLAGPRARALTGLALLALVAGTQFGRELWPAASVRAGVLTFAALTAAGLGYLVFRRLRPGRPVAIAALGIIVAVVAVAAYPRAQTFVESAYLTNEAPAGWAPFQLADVLAWGRLTEDERIALGGTVGSFNQYPLYGARLSNQVQRIGLKGRRGAFRAVSSCELWRAALNEGRYGYVVTTPRIDIWDPFGPRDDREREWTRGDPGVRLVMESEYASVFRIDRPLDPAACVDAG